MTKKKEFVEIGIWETSGNDPCVFVAKTKKRLYKAIWETVKDYWEEEVGTPKPPKDPSKALDIYMKAVYGNERGEYFTFSTEEVL